MIGSTGSWDSVRLALEQTVAPTRIDQVESSAVSGLIVVRGKEGQLNCQLADPSTPGHPFNAWVREVQGFVHGVCRDSQERRKIIEKIDSCSLAIQVTAAPSFVELDDHFACLFAISQAVDGLIFAGQSILGPHGYVLLDAQGGRDHLVQGG